MKLNNVQIDYNKATKGSGGGVYAYGNITISGDNTTINNNNASTYGGGIMIKEEGKILGGTISKNETIKYAGGGVRVDGKLKIENVNIIENSAKTTGGGIDWTNGVLIYKNGIVKDNKSGEQESDMYPIFTEKKEDWSKFNEWNITPIDINLEKNYVRNVDIDNLSIQGMTTTDKYLVFAQMKSEEENTKINIVDKNTYKILNTVDNYCFGHANNMTYNSKNDKCYIAYKKDEESYVTSFKINENYELEDVQTIKTDKYYYALSYNKDDDCFIGINGYNVFSLNENFDSIKKLFSLKPNNLTKQDVLYYNGKIYWICFELGNQSKYQTKFNNRERFSNVLFVYNMNGEFEKTLYISNDVLAGEAESATIEDGKLIIGYNVARNSSTWTKISFCSSNYLKKEIENNDTKDDEKKDNENEEKDSEKNDNEENADDTKNNFVDNTVSDKNLPFSGTNFKYILILFILGLNTMIIITKLKKYKNI